MNWSGKRVLVTGHTGFKGGWLLLWLDRMGAEVCGLALDPPSARSFFVDARVARGVRSMCGDIRDAALVKKLFHEHRPEIVFHLAAQSLVRTSYRDPLGTYSTNVMGTANVLDAARACETVHAIVVVTSDKCYRNDNGVAPFQEDNRLGGYDPYSNSKACAELVTAAYRDSFFNPARYAQHGIAIASARAGNVIGGGDWAEDRLLPDLIRGFSHRETVRIRNPRAVRPWQHVLEPLRGYLMLAESLVEHGPRDGEAWNFGPAIDDAQPVEFIADHTARLWGAEAKWELDGDVQPHEARTLRLDCAKSAERLDWRPLLHLPEALEMTVDWYRARQQGEDMRVHSLAQITRYEASALPNTPSGIAS